MKSFARIVARATGGFTADPDPTTNPEDVPPESLFLLPEQMPADGVPNALVVWLQDSPVGETSTVQVWALDDDTARGDGSGTSQIPKPTAANRWVRLDTAVVVTSPAAQVLTGKPYSGVVYLRQTASTLAAAGTLKVGAAHF